MTGVYPKPLRALLAIVLGILGALGAIVGSHWPRREPPLAFDGLLTNTAFPMCNDLPPGGWTPAHPGRYESIISIGTIVGDPWKDAP